MLLHNLKATFFAVFASFTNLALSASNLLTKYLNKIYIITREIKDKQSESILVSANYNELGILIIVVILLTFFLPYLTTILVQKKHVIKQMNKLFYCKKKKSVLYKKPT